MFRHPSKYRSLTAILLLLSTLGTASVLAGDQTPDELGAMKSIAPVIGRIVNDPDRNYANYRGPDDCKTEADYERTKALLGQFADKPADHKDAVKNYIFETTDQCSCTRAIAGEEFDILMFSLGSSVSEANCL